MGEQRTLHSQTGTKQARNIKHAGFVPSKEKIHDLFSDQNTRNEGG